METPSTGNGVPAAREVSLLAVLNVLLRHRKLLLVLPVIGFLAGGVISQLKVRTYTSTATFLPEAADAASNRLGGVAAQFGLNLSPGRPAESPAFYAELIRSRQILAPVADEKYASTEDRTASKPLPDMLRLEGNSVARRAGAVRFLQSGIGVSTSRETGIVGVSVTTPWPTVSRQIADRVIHYVNEFNVERRQSHARAQRSFTETQRDESYRTLTQAEDRLKVFLQRNREFSGSPQLKFEHDRLQREVDRRQQLYNSLSEAYEQARIDEVRNTAVITVIESPSLPLRPNSRGTAKRAATGFIIGLAFALVIAFLLDYFRSSRSERGSDFEHFVSLRREARAEILLPIVSVGRMFRRPKVDR
jgi:uncharacterized protein involved in exopolysaccharide biosynthesis